MSGYVDADGHVIEDVSAIIRYLEPPFDKMRTVLNILPTRAIGSIRLAGEPPHFRHGAQIATTVPEGA